jgi:general stress protein 26
MSPEPTARLDARFSDAGVDPTPWRDAERVLEGAELYWLSTVRADGRPHVTPLVGAAVGGAMHFCTGLSEQKARNLEHNERVALTTGSNTWAEGLDVVLEGTAVRVTDEDALQAIADAYEEKYGSVWHFDVGDGVFRAGELAAAVFRIDPDKAIAFAKDPHAHTTYRFGAVRD